MLSVIIPARDVAPFVEQTVQSALRQTMPDIEVLVVDDDSRDDTRARVAAIADPRLHLLNGHGRGAAAARNQALAVARGEYVAFLDADDVWLPEHAQRLLGVITSSPQLDLVFAAATWVDDRGEPLPRSVVRWTGPILYHELFVEFVPVTSSALLVRRSALERVRGFDEDMRLGMDHDLCLRIALLHPRNCAGVPEIGLLYRRRPGQNTGNRQDKFRYWQKLVAKHRALAPEHVTPLEALATANHQRALAALAYESGAFAEARAWMSQALRAAPIAMARDRRTWITAAAVLSSLFPAALRLRVEQVGKSLLGRG